jgi:zinc protease
VEKPVNSVTLEFEWQGPSVTSDPVSTYAADVLSQVLRNRASPFHKRLVESGLTYLVDLSYYTQSHVGPIRLFAQTSPDKVTAAERAILEELGKLADESYLPQTLLDDAKKQLGIHALYEREQPSELAHTVGFWWSVASLEYYRDYVPSMQRVTRADIARYARTYLVRKPFVVGALLSPEMRRQTQLTPASLLTTQVVP